MTINETVEGFLELRDALDNRKIDREAARAMTNALSDMVTVYVLGYADLSADEMKLLGEAIRLWREVTNKLFD